MLAAGPALATARKDGATAVLFAHYCGRHAIVALIRRCLAALDVFEACVRLLLAGGARVDAASSNGMRVMPLHSAAAARSVPIARMLIEHGAPVDARRGNGTGGFTPLMEAAPNGQIELIRLLLDNDANRSLRDDQGLTAAAHAAKARHIEVAALCR